MMKEGVRKLTHAAIDTVTDTTLALIKAGVEPEAALKSAGVLTKESVDRTLDEKLGRASASDITHGLNEFDVSKKPNVTRAMSIYDSLSN